MEERCFNEIMKQLKILQTISEKKRPIERKTRWREECKVFIGGIRHCVTNDNLIVSMIFENMNLYIIAYLENFFTIWTSVELLDSQEARWVRFHRNVYTKRS